MILLGLTGKAGCGKDTAADFLCRQHGFYRIAFAGPIRRGLTALLGLTVEQMTDRALKEQPVDWIGKSPRQLAQTLGTEWGRHLVADDIWIRCAAQRIDALGPDARVVVTDVRFEDEADWIRMRGGVLVHIARPAVAPVNAHRSERGVLIAPRDIQIANTGTIDELHQRLDFVMAAVAISQAKGANL